MKVLIVDTYYPAFLDSVYTRQMDLHDRSYQEQWRRLMDECFGTADYYSANLIRLGHEATEVIANCRPMQLQWAREHGVSLRHRLQIRFPQRLGIPIPWLTKEWFYTVLLAQVQAHRPDVIHFQDPASSDSAFLKQIKPYVRLITGQISSPISPRADLRHFDLMLSSLPHYVAKFLNLGLASHIFRLGFEESILKKLTKSPQPFPVVHVGGYGPIHRERNEVLEALIRDGIPLRCWGYGINQLPADSPIRNCYHGEAWGIEMYKVRHDSRIVISKHITEVADVYANIMTLYEATGVGALLMIDKRKDLHLLFKPGKEVIGYEGPKDCVQLIRYYLDHEDERASIAQAGQERTLREHTYYHRMQEFVGIIQKYL